MMKRSGPAPGGERGRQFCSVHVGVVGDVDEFDLLVMRGVPAGDHVLEPFRLRGDAASRRIKLPELQRLRGMAPGDVRKAGNDRPGCGYSRHRRTPCHSAGRLPAAPKRPRTCASPVCAIRLRRAQRCRSTRLSISSRYAKFRPPRAARKPPPARLKSCSSLSPQLTFQQARPLSKMRVTERRKPRGSRWQNSTPNSSAFYVRILFFCELRRVAGA